jgi:hypothetical protein
MKGIRGTFMNEHISKEYITQKNQKISSWKEQLD